MKKFNWVEVDEATSVDWLEPGGYVIEIVDVEDKPEWEALNVVFDVAEGTQAHKFAKMPKEQAWTHQLRQSYKENAQRFFKGFLTALEKSNPGFSIAEWQKASDERELIGLKLGAVINYYHSVSEKGLPRKSYNLARPMSADRIRAGDFTVPEDGWSKEARELDDQEKAKSTAGGSAGGDLYDDCPF